MSSCLSGGSRPFVLDLDIVKSTSITSSPSSRTSSPSSTLSESSNTRKPRTPRKRPNQIYNEAAVLLSSVYPTIFPTKPFHISKATSLHNAPHASSNFLHDPSSELLLPCRVTDHFGFPVHSPTLPSYNRIKVLNNLPVNNPKLLALGSCDDYFDQTSMILDEEMEPVEGIDSILGVASPESLPVVSTCNVTPSRVPYGAGFAGLMMQRGVPALRQVDRGEWWRFPAVDMRHISPRLSSNQNSIRSKNSQKVTVSKKNTKRQDLEPSDTSLEDIPNISSNLMLKLNYKEVVNAWSDRGLPFDDTDMSRPNAHALMLEQVDLFGEGGGIREASVLRYKEKRRTRLFSKKIIRYQVRKENADCRPRMKGRFVRRPTMKKI